MTHLERAKLNAQEIPDDIPPIGTGTRKAAFEGQVAEDIFPMRRKRIPMDDPVEESKEPSQTAQKIPLKPDQKPGKKPTGKPSKTTKDAKKDRKNSDDPPPRQRGLRLNSHEDLRRLLCQVINRLLKKQIDHQVAGKIIYAASTMIELIDKTDLSDRIKAIEEQIKGKR
jgi:hypothetical protein